MALPTRLNSNIRIGLSLGESLRLAQSIQSISCPTSATLLFQYDNAMERTALLTYKQAERILSQHGKLKTCFDHRYIEIGPYRVSCGGEYYDRDTDGKAISAG